MFSFRQQERNMEITPPEDEPLQPDDQPGKHQDSSSLPGESLEAELANEINRRSEEERKKLLEEYEQQFEKTLAELRQIDDAQLAEYEWYKKHGRLKETAAFLIEWWGSEQEVYELALKYARNGYLVDLPTYRRFLARAIKFRLLRIRHGGVDTCGIDDRLCGRRMRRPGKHHRKTA
jgi:hypothetical protein